MLRIKKDDKLWSPAWQKVNCVASMRIPSEVKPNKFQVLYTLIKSVVWSSHWEQSCKGLLSVVVTDILTFRHHHQSQEAYPAELTPVFEAWIKVVLQTLEEMPVYANPPLPPSTPAVLWYPFTLPVQERHREKSFLPKNKTQWVCRVSKPDLWTKSPECINY